MTKPAEIVTVLAPATIGFAVVPDLGPCNNPDCLHRGFRYEGVRLVNGAESSCPYCRPERSRPPVATGIAPRRQPLSRDVFASGWATMAGFFRLPAREDARENYYQAIRWRITDDGFRHAVQQATYSQQRLPTPKALCEMAQGAAGRNGQTSAPARLRAEDVF